MTQNKNILNHMKQGGKITPLQALMFYGCLRLAARIRELKQQGHEIKSETIAKDGKHFSQYWMETK